MRNKFLLITLVMLMTVSLPPTRSDAQTAADQAISKSDDTVRFGTFNISFNRRTKGKLKSDLEDRDAENPKKIAEIIQRVRPDVLLLNEFDYDADGQGIENFQTNFLQVSQNGQPIIKYEYVYFAPVNTGVDTGLDLNGDGRLGAGNDCFGYGTFPGQYAMVVLSKFEIDRDRVRTFQKFLWKDMPGCQWPQSPEEAGKPYYSDEAKQVFRLSSKSHWDVPIKIGERTIHFLAAHPTPPVFDGKEDRNGCRNYDEIRMLKDYITPGKSDYLYDDRGVKGGLEKGANFVIVGDMNADPSDGDSRDKAAELLTKHPLINNEVVPRSDGGSHYAKTQGKMNDKHVGDPAFDTGDFNDGRVGNLRLDYCLPSKTLVIKKSGVFWPKPDQPGGELVSASDHRMVWIDVEK